MNRPELIEKMARYLCLEMDIAPDDITHRALDGKPYPRWYDRRREAGDALKAIEAAGFAVVPRHPTDEMCHAVDHINNQLENDELKAIYKAMIAAAGKET